MQKSILLLVALLAINASLIAQRILVRTADTTKIKSALAIIKEYEQSIFQQIISRTYIQLGELENKQGVSFAIADEQLGITRYWIMLNPMIIKTVSVAVLASVLLHEAMHNGYNMLIYQKIDADSFDEELLHEHIHIYNYELKFLKKIHASSDDIEGRKQVMRKLSIPIL